VTLTAAQRQQIWSHLATDWQVDLGSLLTQIPFHELPLVFEDFANHRHQGRTVITFS